VRERVLGLIMGEFERTRRGLEALYGGPLAERRPNVQRALDTRRATLRLLHHQQIELLRRWRVLQQTGDQLAAEPLLLHLLLTVNAIASGIGTTG
jgi:phosphoenolpyruvate carboxylase